MPTHKKQQFHTLYISKIVQENRHAISVYFQIPKRLKDVFTYKAGQYITLRTRILGRFVLRSYSLSSCSSTDNYFRICIKRKIGGLVSGFLVDTLRKGDELEIFPPLGDFSPSPTDQAKNYFLYAAGSGITPIVSVLKCLLAEEKYKAQKVVLFYTNRNQQLAIYWNELKELQQQFADKFIFHPIFTRAKKDWQGLRNFYTTKDYSSFLLQNYGQEEWQNSAHFICGPTAMMQTVESALKEDLGIGEERVYVEYFDMEKQAQETLAHRKKTAAKLAIPAKVSQDDEEVISSMILLNGQPHYVPIQKGETVLAACLQQNMDVPFMCESGVCTTCKASLLEGQVVMNVDYALTEEEIQEGAILTCQAVPVSTKVVVDFDG